MYYVCIKRYVQIPFCIAIRLHVLPHHRTWLYPPPYSSKDGERIWVDSTLCRHSTGDNKPTKVNKVKTFLY